MQFQSEQKKTLSTNFEVKLKRKSQNGIRPNITDLKEKTDKKPNQAKCFRRKQGQMNYLETPNS